MSAVSYRSRTPKVSIRRFLAPLRNAFITRSDGSSWSKAANTWRIAPSYVEGLIRPGSHKNLRGIGKRLDINEHKIRRFISESPWEHGSVQQHLSEHLPEMFASPQAMLIIDDTDFLKHGHDSVGVKRQYSGSVGGVTNCQVAVDCVLAVPDDRYNADHLTWPLGIELYFPEEWIRDDAFKQRRHARGLPEDISFRAKPAIALELLSNAREASVPHACVGADADYGTHRSFRKQLRDWDEPYILGVGPKDVKVISESTPIEQPGRRSGRGRPPNHPRYPEDVVSQSPMELTATLEEDDWTELTWAEGTDEPLTGRFFRTHVRVVKYGSKRHATVKWDGC